MSSGYKTNEHIYRIVEDVGAMIWSLTEEAQQYSAPTALLQD